MGDILKRKARDVRARRLRKENLKSVLKWYDIGPNNNITGYCKSGELFAFLGPIASDAGIMKELAGIHPLRNGANKVFFEDAPVAETGSIYIDVHCSDILFDNFTVLETITYSAELRVQDKTHASELTALRLLKEMGLKDIAEHRVGKVLTWQRRMILLATHVAAECGIVFFDNPTKDLDASAAVAMIRAMQNLARSSDNVMNILVISINSITFREYVRLDRVQLLLKYSGVKFSSSHGATANKQKHNQLSYQHQGGGCGDATVDGGAGDQDEVLAQDEVEDEDEQAAVGASSIYFGAGSSALTYFVRMGRMPTPGASISDFLMDLVDTVRFSELIALESEYRRDLGGDAVLFSPSSGREGVGVTARESSTNNSRRNHGNANGSGSGSGESSRRSSALDLTPRRRSSSGGLGSGGRRSRSRLDEPTEHDNSRSFLPFAQLELEQGGEESHRRGTLSSNSLAGMSDGPATGTSASSLFSPSGTNQAPTGWQDGRGQQHQPRFSFVAAAADLHRIGAACLALCWDEDRDEFQMPPVGTEALWCLWRGFAVRWRDTSNVLTLWLVSGGLVALGLVFCCANSLTADTDGVYNRLVLLTMLPYLLVVVGAMWNWDDYKDRAVFVYERSSGFYSVNWLSPLCSMVADICVYRLAPPLITALVVYPAVGLQRHSAKFTIFVELVLLLSMAGSCFAKAVLNFLGVLQRLNSAKISMVTSVLVTTLMVGGICPNFSFSGPGGALGYRHHGAHDPHSRFALDAITGSSTVAALNATSALGGLLERSQETYFPLKRFSFFYKVINALTLTLAPISLYSTAAVDMYNVAHLLSLHSLLMYLLLLLLLLFLLFLRVATRYTGTRWQRLTYTRRLPLWSADTLFWSAWALNMCHWKMQWPVYSPISWSTLPSRYFVLIFCTLRSTPAIGCASSGGSG